MDVGLEQSTPIAALSNTGKMQIAGVFNSQGIRIPGRYAFSAVAGLESAIELEIPPGEYNAIRGVVGSSSSSTIHFFDAGWQGGSAALSAGAINLDPKTSITFGSWNNPIAYFRKSDGFIGFGTTSPDARLSVKGQVHAQEVKVDLNGALAPDYVFAKDYKLPTLEEVKAYIDQHHHLPEVQSAKEMDEEGINVGEMNLVLLKKVEELTLYILQQEERIKALERKGN